MATVNVPQVPGVYMITNTTTGKFYVGSSKNCRNRWRSHVSMLRSGKSPCVHLQNAWNKYGECSFCVSIIEETSAYKQAEQGYIDSLKPAYNIATSVTSAMLGRKHTEGTKSKMRTSATGRTISEPARTAMSAAATGRKHSQESIEKMRIAHAGQSPSMTNRAATVARNKLGLSDVSRAKIRAALIGRKLSEETVAKRSATNTGSKRSPEARARMSAAQKARFSKEKTNG